MSPKIKTKGKSQRSDSRSRTQTRTPKPHIALESEFSERDKVLKQLHLKPSDILSQASRGGHLIFVTKNGMKIKVKK